MSRTASPERENSNFNIEKSSCWNAIVNEINELKKERVEGKAKQNVKSARRLSNYSKSNQDVVECEVCKKRFRSVHYAKEHKKIHSGEKQFQCSLCSYSCRQKGQLKSHEKRKHYRNFSFKCDLCGNGYHTKLELQVHTNSHTGERPHMCDVCGKSYPSKSNMMGHKRTHHPGKDGTIKRFPCESCEKIFVTKRSHQQHQRHHTGETQKFLCDVCGKGLASKEILKAHRLIHTGEKTIVCEVCFKAFSRSKYLRVHMLTHTGEKPHRCEECGRCFTQRSTLVIHQRSHPNSQNSAFACGTCGLQLKTEESLRKHKTVSHCSENKFTTPEQKRQNFQTKTKKPVEHFRKSVDVVNAALSTVFG